MNLFTTIHLLFKPGLIILNIIYLASVGFHATSTDILGLNKTTNLKETGAGFANALTFSIFIEEIVMMFGIPLGCAIQWCCWGKTNEDKCCSKLMEYYQFCDVTYTFIFASFSNVDLFYLGARGWWYIAIILRLAYYSVTFASAVIAGLRFIYAIYFCCSSLICCECANNEDGVELRGFKQLFIEIGLKMITIALKLLACSSAFATYLQIGILVQSLGFRAAYFTFTLLRGVTALFSLTFAATMIRWAVLKESEAENGTILKCLYDYEPQTHISFFLDMLCYGGLLVLNLMIIHGINNDGFVV